MRDRVVSNWENFLEALKEDFIPQWIYEKREDEFQIVKQSLIIVSQYAAKFTRLSKYCLRMVEWSKQDQAIYQGASPELKRALMPLLPMS